MEFQIFFFCIRKDNIVGKDQTNINTIALHSITVFMILFEMTHPGRYGTPDQERYGPAVTMLKHEFIRELLTTIRPKMAEEILCNILLTTLSN